MSKYTVNEEISLEAADGFKVMTDEEISAVSSGDASKRWGLWDKERHVMILADWKKYNGLLLGLTNISKIAARNEELNRKLYGNYGYKPEGTIKRAIDGQEAEGYRFSYTVEGTEQSASCLLVRYKKTVYRFIVNGRTENRERDEEILKHVLNTAAFL